MGGASNMEYDEWKERWTFSIRSISLFREGDHTGVENSRDGRMYVIYACFINFRSLHVKPRKRTPSLFIAEAEIFLIWEQNWRSESIVTPRSTTKSEPKIGLLFKVYKKPRGFFPNWKRWDLLLLIFNCQESDQIWNFARVSWKHKLSAGSTIDVYSLTSSANNLHVTFTGRMSGKSLINSKKRRGPMTVPWGRPLSTEEGEERKESIKTSWERPERNSLIRSYYSIS